MQFVVEKAETPRPYHNVDRLTLRAKEHVEYTLTIDMPILPSINFTMKKGDHLHIHCTTNQISNKEQKNKIIFHATLLKPGTYSASGLMIVLCGFSISQLGGISLSASEETVQFVVDVL